MSENPFPITWFGRSGQPTTIEAVRGDILEFEGDAIVCPVNTYMKFNGGVVRSVSERAGDEFRRAAAHHGPLKIGQAVSFPGGGRLKVSRVILTPTVEEMVGQSTPETVGQAVRAALKRADADRCATVAFPAMGTGVGSVSYEDCAEVMLREIHLHIDPRYADRPRIGEPQAVTSGRHGDQPDAATTIQRIALFAWKGQAEGFLAALEAKARTMPDVSGPSAE